ncbi:hypothetical protein [Mycobacterium genavense]|nr:hypothetical protein [Mycobacterium genavense]
MSTPNPPGFPAVPPPEGWQPPDYVPPRYPPPSGYQPPGYPPP